MATTAHVNAVAGGGLLGGIHALTGQHALPGSFQLHENEATAAATAGTPLAKRNAADEAPRPHFPLIGFDGKPLAKTSAALDARCQTAVLDVLRRSSGQAADRGSSGSGAAAASSFSEQPPSSARAPTFYVDPLNGVHVAPLNGTHGPEAIRIVYLIGVGGRPRAHLIVSRLLYALYRIQPWAAALAPARATCWRAPRAGWWISVVRVKQQKREDAAGSSCASQQFISCGEREAQNERVGA